MLKFIVSIFIHRPIAAWLWTFFIVLVCNWPAKNIPHSSFTGMDKIVHITFFLIWTALWLTSKKINSFQALWIGTFLGIGIEISQWLLPFNRSFDWLDLVADTTGIILGLFLYQRIFSHYLQRLY